MPHNKSAASCGEYIPKVIKPKAGSKSLTRSEQPLGAQDEPGLAEFVEAGTQASYPGDDIATLD
jgi:hypothetical protein